MALVGVRRMLMVWFFLSGLFLAAGANATSLRWTIPSTILNGYPGAQESSIYGAFDWDADTRVVSNVVVTVVLNGISTRLTSSSPNSDPFIVLYNGSNTVGSPVVGVDYSNLTNVPSTANATLYGGDCSLLQNINDCIGINPSGSTYTPLIGSFVPAPTNPIPTLSEWAQILMMLAMIATAGFYGWRMKQR
jgi:hypothetical protein